VTSPATVPVFGAVSVNGTVNVGNSAATPVNVAVVNGTTTQAVNVFNFVSVPGGSASSGLATIYTNSNNSPVALTNVNAYLTQAGCSLVPGWMLVEVTDISGLESAVGAPFAGATGTAFCGAATVPGTLVIGPGQSLAVEMFTNTTVAFSVPFIASVSGYVMQ
jgi:hypothetical protein